MYNISVLIYKSVEVKIHSIQVRIGTTIQLDAMNAATGSMI